MALIFQADMWDGTSADDVDGFTSVVNAIGDAAVDFQKPVLLLAGEQSEFRGRLGEEGKDERLRELFRNVRIETVPDAGHMMHHERPAEVARLIEAFLADEGSRP